MDLGQRRRGVDVGPSALRYAGLATRLQALGHAVTDNGDIDVPTPSAQEIEEGIKLNARNLQSVAAVCRDVFQQSLACLSQNETAIFLGGDHSISIGTVSAMDTHGNNVGVIWVDAHADFNTPGISPSGNIHGMALAALMGRGPAELTQIGGAEPKLQPSEVVLIGTRDLDLQEREELRQSGVMVLTMREIDEIGMASATRKALAHLSGVERIHISLDMDSLDPNEAPGVGTPVPGGLSYREAHLLMETLAETQKVSSLDIVEVNPLLDERNRTAKLGVELATSLFGQRIF